MTIKTLKEITSDGHFRTNTVIQRTVGRLQGGLPTSLVFTQTKHRSRKDPHVSNGHINKTNTQPNVGKLWQSRTGQSNRTTGMALAGWEKIRKKLPVPAQLCTKCMDACPTDTAMTNFGMQKSRLDGQSMLT